MKSTEFLEQAEIDRIFALERRGSGRFERGFEQAPVAPEVVEEPIDEPTADTED